jgi:hypothetical protein
MELKSRLASAAAFCVLVGVMAAPAFAQQKKRAVPPAPAASAKVPEKKQDAKPNILVIMGDDVGWFNVGAYHRGIMSGKTPSLDKLAPGCRHRRAQHNAHARLHLHCAELPGAHE